MTFLHQPVADGPIHKVDQGLPIAVIRAEHHRSVNESQLVPRQNLKRLLQCAEAAGKNDEPITEGGHSRLARMHIGHDFELGHSAMPHLTVEELFRDHPNDLSPASQRRIGHHPHQTHTTPAVHQAVPGSGDCCADIGGE